MTARGGAYGVADDPRRAALVRALGRWREQHGAQEGVAPEHVDILEVETLAEGRPGVIDVVADMDGRLAHAVLGLRRPGDELHVLGAVEEPLLGSFEVDGEMVIALDALHDAEAARVLLGAVAGGDDDPRGVGKGRRRAARPVRPGGSEPGVVTVVHDDEEVASLAFDRRRTLSVFPWLRRGPHPGMTLLAGLDEAGFNHLAAPIAFWRRSGRDLGVVQEFLPGTSGGWALALASLRDLMASGVAPDAAGGDFAPEAFGLGTMTARMHVALDRAFGRRAGDAAAWVAALEALAARPGDHAPGDHAPGDHAPRDSLFDALDGRGATDGDATMRDSLEALRRSGLHPPTIRTHGDFHLGRTARTDHGWVVSDCMPGGAAPSSDDPEQPVFRSPLADVADFTWSLHRAAVVAAGERGPRAARSGLGALAAAWEERNRRAFVAGYLATPGVGALVPADRRVVRRLLALFELLRRAGGPGWPVAA